MEVWIAVNKAPKKSTTPDKLQVARRQHKVRGWFLGFDKYLCESTTGEIEKGVVHKFTLVKIGTYPQGCVIRLWIPNAQVGQQVSKGVWLFTICRRNGCLAQAGLL